MRRRLSLTAALVLLLSLLCACAAQHAQEMDENGYELYFLSDPNSAGGGDAIRTQEKRLTLDGAMETEDCVRALMEALLAGPDEPSLSSPIPEGTALKSLKVSGRRAQIDLSAQYARLTGIDLSLADYCITLTLTQLPNVNAVSITADGRELPYRETQVLLSADTLLSSRESGLRPITVSLYFQTVPCWTRTIFEKSANEIRILLMNPAVVFYSRFESSRYPACKRAFSWRASSGFS